MSSEIQGKRWRLLAWVLPTATLHGFIVAERLHLNSQFSAFLRPVLPASFRDLVDALPIVGWILLTTLCSGYLCFADSKMRNVSGWQFWPRVICLTPLITLIHIFFACIFSIPGGLLLLSVD